MTLEVIYSTRDRDWEYGIRTKTAANQEQNRSGEVGGTMIVRALLSGATQPTIQT